LGGGKLGKPAQLKLQNGNEGGDRGMSHGAIATE